MLVVQGLVVALGVVVVQVIQLLLAVLLHQVVKVMLVLLEEHTHNKVVEEEALEPHLLHLTIIMAHLVVLDCVPQLLDKECFMLAVVAVEVIVI
jgi:hypothetical protein